MYLTLEISRSDFESQIKVDVPMRSNTTTTTTTTTVVQLLQCSSNLRVCVADVTVGSLYVQWYLVNSTLVLRQFVYNDLNSGLGGLGTLLCLRGLGTRLQSFLAIASRRQQVEPEHNVLDLKAYLSDEFVHRDQSLIDGENTRLQF